MTPEQETHTYDRTRLAALVRNWIEHNEGHKQSYLEWRDKLRDKNLPATVEALEHVAALTEQANRELRSAAAELGAGDAATEPGPHQNENSDAHDHSHSHSPHSHLEAEC